MLDSMMENPRPTRAEVTDVYYAGIAGTDATMLSGESASGDFPKEAVHTMSTINLEAEKNFDYLRAFEDAYAYVESSNAESAYLVVRDALLTDAKYILAFSEKGRLVKALSRFRPNAIIMGLVHNKKLVNKFGAHYGVYAQYQDDLEVFHDDEKVNSIAIELGIKPGTSVIVANKTEFRRIVIK